MKRFKVSKWICLAFAILMNGFIVAYSLFDSSTTAKLNSFITNIVVKNVNKMTNKEVERKPLQSIDLDLSSEDSYKYNYINGYQLNEIPIGSAKEVTCSLSPLDATDKAIFFWAIPSNKVRLNQNNNVLTIIGMETGDCEIHAKSHDGNFESSLDIKVVDTVAPTEFEISLDKTNLSGGEVATVIFDIDGGILGHKEIINTRYYDTTKLGYESLDEEIVEIDNYGVITPKKVGSTSIRVFNGDFERNANITVSSIADPVSYSNLNISGSSICYANDLLLDQNSNNNHYQLKILDNKTVLDPLDFIWTSSNDLLAKVDRFGILRGFRKSSLEDENVIITATSKLTGQECHFEVVVKNQIPQNMNSYLEIDGKKVWTQHDYTVAVGDEITVGIQYDIQTSNTDIIVTSEDETIISVTNQQSKATLHVLKEGACKITIKSIINSNLVFETRYQVVKAGAIDTKDVESVGKYIRKSLGHAAVFMAAQIFTYLTLFMFLYNKKWWFYSSISLGEGLFISGLSELIQYFVPSRSGALLDVLIDFSGVVVGALLAFLIVLLIKKKRKRE